MSEVMRPGDTLIVGIAPGFSIAQVQKMKVKFREMIPGCEIVYVAGATGMTIYRPNASGSSK